MYIHVRTCRSSGEGEGSEVNRESGCADEPVLTPDNDSRTRELGMEERENGCTEEQENAGMEERENGGMEEPENGCMEDNNFPNGHSSRESYGIGNGMRTQENGEWGNDCTAEQLCQLQEQIDCYRQRLGKVEQEVSCPETLS